MTVPAADFGRVAVLLGGTSAEREISLKSGGAVLAALRRLGIEAEGVDPAAPDFMQRLEHGGFHRALIALHGRGGEDGVIQGALEVIGMPYTGSGVLGSALSMDKIRCKQVWLGAGLPTAPFVTLMSAADVDRVAEQAGYPVMVKPAREGSSLGVVPADDRAGLESAWHQAMRYDDSVMAERRVDGPEYTVAVLEHRPLPVIRLETPRGFYDFEAKYEAGTTQYHCPCGLDDGTEAAMQDLAMRAFTAVGAAGWGRVDLMMDREGRSWLLEVNTVPGMTDHSLVPMAAAAAGIGFDDLARRILQTSRAREATGR